MRVWSLLARLSLLQPLPPSKSITKNKKDRRADTRMPASQSTPLLRNYLARRIEEFLPSLDKTMGELIFALSQTKQDTWKYQARQLRTALFRLGSAIERLEKEQLTVDHFSLPWRVFEPLIEYGDRKVAPLARDAQKEYEPIWREVVRQASVPSRTRKEIVRKKSSIAILCSSCGKNAFVFAPKTEYTGKMLAADEYKFLSPFVSLGMTNILVAYLKKYLPYDVAEYCVACDAFYCKRCSPHEIIRIQFSDKEPIMSTCPKGHERQVDER